MEHHNGIYFLQSQDFIKMYCASHIDKILGNHGWQVPKKAEPILVEPLYMFALKELETSTGPSNEREAKLLEEDMGFGYRAARGSSYMHMSLADLTFGMLWLNFQNSLPTQPKCSMGV